MKGNQQVIDGLNELLALELTAADQYLLNARVFLDLGLGHLHERIQHEHEEELEHATRLIDRILFLEGTPDLGQRAAITVSRDVPTMLKNDLAMEMAVVATIKRLIGLCETAEDYQSRTLLRELLGDTEEDHVYWLERQLGLIDKVGLQNYLQSQMK